MTDHDKKKENNDTDLDVCTQAPEFAEHARPNESPQDACDDGRAGTDGGKPRSSDR
jgi:hypothetical protein